MDLTVLQSHVGVEQPTSMIIHRLVTENAMKVPILYLFETVFVLDLVFIWPD